MTRKSNIAFGIFAGVLCTIAFCRPLPAFALSTVSLAPAGDGVFLLQGTGIEDAAALELTVLYDTETLANPRVAEGPLIAGGMTAVNPNVPGTVRIVIIRLAPIRGSGVIATLSFDRKGSSSGRIRALGIKLADIKGTPLMAQALINNPSGASTVASASSQNRDDTSGATVQPTGMGTPGIPAAIAPATVLIAGQPNSAVELKGSPDVLRNQEEAAQPSAPETILPPRKEPLTVARKTDAPSNSGEVAASATIVPRTIYTQKSILDRFREYQGERTAAAFISLFEEQSMIGCRQEPTVALSDGKSVVKVRFISTAGNKTASDVAVWGARLISLKRDPDYTNTWVVEVLPEKGGYQASIAVSQGELKIVYPLTIAPRIESGLVRSGVVTRPENKLSLKTGEATKSSIVDRGHDSRWDYLDDYIVTANYLAVVGNTHAQGPGSPAGHAGP